MKKATFIVQFNTRGELLLLKRPADHPLYPNQWTLPGGKVDEGEDVHTCAHREMKEETGIHMLIFEQMPVILAGAEHLVYSFESCKLYTEDKLPKEFPNREHVEYGWFEADDLPEENLSGLVAELLAYQAEQSFSDLMDDLQ